uniref:Uncharacterized protein n=1 Tax=Candidatus Methanosuratincola petrocarbonis (ex Vanwonterghem et al. 2016) TaxID=1867261 RepID=A0A7J3UZB4_9CREN
MAVPEVVPKYKEPDTNKRENLQPLSDKDNPAFGAVKINRSNLLFTGRISKKAPTFREEMNCKYIYLNGIIVLIWKEFPLPM